MSHGSGLDLEWSASEAASPSPGSRSAVDPVESTVVSLDVVESSPPPSAPPSVVVVVAWSGSEAATSRPVMARDPGDPGCSATTVYWSGTLGAGKSTSNAPLEETCPVATVLPSMVISTGPQPAPPQNPDPIADTV